VYSWVLFASVINHQVTDPETLALKITPFGMPPVPFPVMTKDPPPEAKDPPMWKLPLVHAPVDNVRIPRLPARMPLGPVMAIKVEPLRFNPALLPLRVPVLFVIATELANAAIGSTRGDQKQPKHALHTYCLRDVGSLSMNS
jgi:hypothetical protein